MTERRVIGEIYGVKIVLESAYDAKRSDFDLAAQKIIAELHKVIVYEGKVP